MVVTSSPTAKHVQALVRRTFIPLVSVMAGARDDDTSWVLVLALPCE